MKPVQTEFSSGAGVSVTCRHRLTVLNDRLRPRDLSAGQVPVQMLRSQEQNLIQEILVRHYHPDKGSIVRAVKKPGAAVDILPIIEPASRRAVRHFLTREGRRRTPVMQAIEREWEARVCSGLSRLERETLQNLMRIAAQDRCSGIETSGDLTYAEK